MSTNSNFSKLYGLKPVMQFRGGPENRERSKSIVQEIPGRRTFIIVRAVEVYRAEKIARG